MLDMLQRGMVLSVWLSLRDIILDSSGFEVHLVGEGAAQGYPELSLESLGVQRLVFLGHEITGTMLCMQTSELVLRIHLSYPITT